MCSLTAAVLAADAMLFIAVVKMLLLLDMLQLFKSVAALKAAALFAQAVECRLAAVHRLIFNSWLNIMADCYS